MLDKIKKSKKTSIIPLQLTETEEEKFNHGIFYDSYKKLGAHPMIIDGTTGVYFAVWAPNAQSVSVVGDFNEWKQECHVMKLHESSGVYDLFIPHIPVGSLYKYAVKQKNGTVCLKADPYANAAELRPANASIVTDLSKYKWNDKTWLVNREKVHRLDAPICVYEMHLGSWKKPEDGREFYNYREIAPMLVEYVNKMGYTHVELLPVMEHPLDASWGYQVTGYYAPTSRYGNAEDFMYFIDTLHQAAIGVILDWVPAHFPKDEFGLAAFDGTCLYEHLDSRQGFHPQWGTLLYNYGRPQVKNFLISNALFWAEQFHVDGLRMDAVSSMLYLDFGKTEGQWIPNMYGGNENLEAIEFFRHLNSIFKRKHPDVMLLAEESTAWSQTTEKVEEDGLGFDYKWNLGWMNDFLRYMRQDPYFRGGCHNDLTFSMIYAYSENFMLPLSHDEVVHGKGTLLNKMPGEDAKKFANLRLALGFFMTHPGKKLLFMGQDFAQRNEWAEYKSLDWDCLNNENHKQIQDYMKAFIHLYKENPALYEKDQDREGFAWINCVDWEKTVVSFLRKSDNIKDTVIVVCNFSDVAYEEHILGVPYSGKYKEVLNSDALTYGGSGFVNPRVKIAEKQEMDGRPYRMKIKLAPLSISVFKYSNTEEKSVDNKSAVFVKKTEDKISEKREGLKKFLQDKIEKEEKSRGEKVVEKVMGKGEKRKEKGK